MSPPLPRRRRRGDEQPQKEPDREQTAAEQEGAQAEAEAAGEEQPAGAAEAPVVTAIPQSQAQPAPLRGGRVAITARARYVRSTPRKARQLCEQLRGLPVDEARELLRFSNRAVARDWAKLLESAVANARHNYALDAERLVVREVYADAGPTLKRYRPRAMGRATPILKRTAHLTITLTTER